MLGSETLRLILSISGSPGCPASILLLLGFVLYLGEIVGILDGRQ